MVYDGTVEETLAHGQSKPFAIAGTLAIARRVQFFNLLIVFHFITSNNCIFHSRLKLHMLIHNFQIKIPNEYLA